MYTTRGCIQAISVLINMAETSITTENKNRKVCIRLTQPNVNKRNVKLKRILDLTPGSIGTLIMQKTKGKERQKDSAK
jgi:hypothetical protein